MLVLLIPPEAFGHVVMTLLTTTPFLWHYVCLLDFCVFQLPNTVCDKVAFLSLRELSFMGWPSDGDLIWSLLIFLIMLWMLHVSMHCILGNIQSNQDLMLIKLVFAYNSNLTEWLPASHISDDDVLPLTIYHYISWWAMICGKHEAQQQVNTGCMLSCLRVTSESPQDKLQMEEMQVKEMWPFIEMGEVGQCSNVLKSDCWPRNSTESRLFMYFKCFWIFKPFRFLQVYS